MTPTPDSTAPLTIHLMTAALSPGDAIGNYLLTQARLLRQWGGRVYLYADHVDPTLGKVAARSHFYHPTGRDILWFHYSIYADNLELARRSPDYKIMDYHGISPPRLFDGQNAYLADLCRRAQAALPTLASVFDAQVVHSELMRQELTAHGFAPETTHLFPLCVDAEQFATGPDPALSVWLARLRYLLFVGRVVPQKDILALVRLFAAVHAARPDVRLIVVGSRHLTPAYQREIDRLARRLGVEQQIFFSGPVYNPAVLAALYRHAAFYVALSEWESFCAPVAEAAFFGTPSVVQALPPLPEVAGPAGVVIDKSQVEAAAAAIVQYLDDPMAQQARRQTAHTWGQRYTSAALAANMLTFLRRLWNL